MTNVLDWRRFDLPGADVRLAQFCDGAAAQDWFARLEAEIPWQRHRLRIFGRPVDAPRLSSWIGDPGAVYVYSGSRFVPHGWTAACAELREQLLACGAGAHNSVLCNLYRDGRDSMGWHSDDEAELGPEPLIASLSFGAVRRLRLRHRCDRALRLDIDLPSGSVLLMAAATQRNYRHAIAKTARPVGARLNLTFRSIVAAAACNAREAPVARRAAR